LAQVVQVACALVAIPGAMAALLVPQA